MTRIRMYLWESMIVPKNRIFHNFPIRGQNKGSQSMSETFYLCEHCLADNELREEVRSRGEIIDKCPICQSTGGRAMPVTDSMVRRIFRALVRLNYSEWDYNHHIGGESLQSLVFGGHEIFDLNEKASELAFEGVFLLLEEEWYPEKSEDISLGGGYWDGGILAGLRDRLDPSFENILHHALKINYFELEENVLRLVESLRSDITRDVLAGTTYSRARIGVKERLKRPEYLNWTTKYYFLPFTQADIGNPPVYKATEGRLNRSRVSILYLASDPKTAVAELRPHPGHIVSTADFRALRPLLIADFSQHDLRNFLNDERLEVLRSILSFSAVLNLPVQPERSDLYVLTQLFSDCIRKAGYEGISFRSSLGEGTNLACFVPDAFEQVPNSEAALEVRSLHYELAPLDFLTQNYDRANFEKDGDDTLATLFHGLSRRS